jgi:tetratricopeptide (TPR) repeat protein
MKKDKSIPAQTAASLLEKAAKKEMAGKKSKGLPAPARVRMEPMMRDLHRVLKEREFGTIEEANAFLQTLTGAGLRDELEHAAPLSKCEQAQELAYEAMEARTDKQARRLAQQALAFDPDCVDALLLLAEMDAATPEALMTALEKAVAAGERSLGAAFFAENKGYFWGVVKTRPYMRARFDLGHLLMSAGRLEEAIRHFEGLLELNPNDNQGVRDFLLGCYLSVKNLAGAQRLLQDYKDDASAVFAWGRTLERFLSGDLPGATHALHQARRRNRYVEQYLTMQRPLPKERPETYCLGSDEEAVFCLAALSGAWADNPLAAGWLWEKLGLRSLVNRDQTELF